MQFVGVSMNIVQHQAIHVLVLLLKTKIDCDASKVYVSYIIKNEIASGIETISFF